ncbi:MAG: biotin--[acetyl-CoA-carboxylase] ligase [Betaproteobacteria bacterium]|nr:biotin--[acetyl-CoA-carboxylase] ligase [Betaproteobacteria bacterium]
MHTHTLNVVRHLSAREFVSGEAIAGRLGVTRATVWNAIREAESLGVVIEKVRGLGYRLGHDAVWLDAAHIGAALGPDAARFHVEVVPVTESTNSDLMARAAGSAASGTVLVAEMQTRGRGRRGRQWLSPLGSALTFSVLWRFEQAAASLSGLSLVVGLACAEAIAATGARGVGVKWPNDLLVDHRKLGGILIELQGDALGPSTAVIGIGVNVDLPDATIRAIDQPVTDVRRAGGAGDRNVLLAMLLRSLAAWIDRFDAGGFAPIEPAFRDRHVLQGQAVNVSLPNGDSVGGTVEGVAPDGALLIRTGGGIRRFHGGEVSVRRDGA